MEIIAISQAHNILLHVEIVFSIPHCNRFNYLLLLCSNGRFANRNRYCELGHAFALWLPVVDIQYHFNIPIRITLRQRTEPCAAAAIDHWTQLYCETGTDLYLQPTFAIIATVIQSGKSLPQKTLFFLTIIIFPYIGGNPLVVVAKGLRTIIIFQV